jgi:hypothetical protein
MMKLRYFTIWIFVLLFLFPVFLKAQSFNEMTEKGFKMEQIESIILEDFETNDKGWTVSASRFKTDPYPILKSGIEGRPIALTGSAFPVDENKYIMGVRSSFSRKGYNKIWVYPEEEIVIPGRAKKLDVWVWGGNYYYNLEAHVRDYRGIVYKLPLGSLHFMGWRNMSITIPSNIPQNIRYLPMEKPLTFVRFEIWTQPTERVDDFIIYFDHMKVLTDIYKERFDGDVLADRSRDIWSNSSEAGDSD